MSDDRILVVDEGTTGTRALVFDGHGTRLSASYSEFTQHHPAPDRVEHDAEEIWRLTLDRIHDALQAATSRPPISSRSGSPTSAAPACCGTGRRARR